MIPRWLEWVLVPITWPLAGLYSWLMDIRNWAYDEGLLAVHRLETPVVSVGNLTMGGTGKTPVIALLLDWCRHQGIRASVISRGYRRQSRGVMAVDPNDVRRGGAYYGDEPFWLAQRYREFQIVVAEDRVAGAQLSIQTYHPQIIFLDDGFQHRRLGRDLDIALVDATEPQRSYRLFPAGRLREKLIGLERAQFVLVTKKNLARPDRYSQMLMDLRIPQQKLVELEYRLGSLLNLVTGESRVLTSLKRRPVLLVCGIAKPASFLEMIESQMQADVAGLIAYPDHTEYGVEDLKDIEARAQELDCEAIVCTQKDAVKLKGLSALTDVRWWSVDLQLIPVQSLEPIYESLRRVLS